MGNLDIHRAFSFLAVSPVFGVAAFALLKSTHNPSRSGGTPLEI